MRRYRAVLFDFFGTLTHAVSRGPAHADIARTLGCDPNAFTDILDRSFLARAQGRYGNAGESLLKVAHALAVEPTSTQIRAALAARVSAVRADTRLRADAVPVLEEVRRRDIRTALVSDCTHELPQILPSLPIAPLLDTCVYSINLGTCKPNPRMYLSACTRLRVPPADCLYVGDGGSRELSGARSLGMTAVRLATPDQDSHLRFDGESGWSGPDIGSLADLISLLDTEPAGL